MKSNGYTGELRVLKSRLLTQADVSDGSAFARHRSAKMLSKSVGAAAALRIHADKLKRVNLVKNTDFEKPQSGCEANRKTIRRRTALDRA
jgi:hypothetical protein